ncbi:MAG: hypothetical protein J0I09_08000 [Sphingobacteriia bacterium]|nr:hypothetical protein [Sphingobacteriia bacterium]
MSKYNHMDNLAELEEKVLIYTGYDYTNNDPYGLAEQFFQFCQQNLSEEQGDYQIQPARFMVVNKETVNAWATRRYNYYVVGINMGTLTTLHQFFVHRGGIFDVPAMAEYITLESKLDTTLDILMYQSAVQFTYYHELAHLIQYSPLPGTDDCSAPDIQQTEEAYAVGAGKDDPYELEKHIREFDADLLGAHYICLHVLQYWEKLPEADRTQANLELLLSLGTSSIFSYFIFLLRKYPEMYYAAFDHPHPLIRVLYIIDMFIKTTQENVPAGIQIKSESILQRAFSITQPMFTFGGGEDQVKKYADLFKEEKQKIEAYVNDVLIPESRKTPTLVLERMAAKNGLH